MKTRPQNPDMRGRLEHLAGFEESQFAGRSLSWAATLCGRERRMHDWEECPEQEER